MTLALILCGALVGAGLFLLIRQLVTPQPHLQQAIDRLGPQHLATAVHDDLVDPHQETESDTAAPDLYDRAGAWTERMVGRLPGFSTPHTDLDLLGRSSRRFYGEKALAASFGFLMVPVFVGLLQLLGYGIPPIIPAGAGLFFAVILWFLPDLKLRSEAGQARDEFVQAVVAYLQLVAIKRAAGGFAVNTMLEAATISESWTMARIRQELTRAQWAHVQPWDALEQMAVRTGLPELGEVGDIMRLAGEHGAAVHEQLLARAGGLQHRLLTQEQTDAQSKTTSMAYPITALFAIFTLALILPVGLSVMTS